MTTLADRGPCDARAAIMAPSGTPLITGTFVYIGLCLLGLLTSYLLKHRHGQFGCARWLQPPLHASPRAP